MTMRKSMYRNVMGCLLIGITILVSAYSKDDAKKEDTLYTRLGKTEGISAVVDQFLANVVADNTINGKFAATVSSSDRVQALRNNLIDQICQGTGGPCTYKGKTMLQAHTGMNITDAEFNALVADLVASLDKYKVPEKEKNELLAILGPMKTDIVGK
jgi:hemoglobin